MLDKRKTLLRQSGAEYVTIFDESPLTEQCRRDMANMRAKMNELNLHPSDALCDAMRLMLVEYDTLFPSPTFYTAQPSSHKKCVYVLMLCYTTLQICSLDWCVAMADPRNHRLLHVPASECQCVPGSIEAAVRDPSQAVWHMADWFVSCVCWH